MRGRTGRRRFAQDGTDPLAPPKASRAVVLNDYSEARTNEILPVESKTRTNNGRVGSAWRTAHGEAGRNWAEQGADISIGPEAPVPLALQGTVNNCSERLFASTNKGNPM